MPLKDLAGSENTLTMLFRVIPENHKDEPIYFTHRVRVPAIEEDARGDAFSKAASMSAKEITTSTGSCAIAAERVCSSYWDIGGVS